MLRGNFLAKVDAKGRLKVPSSFRSVIEPEYGSEFFVTSLRGDNVRVYPMPIYAKLETRLSEASAVKPSVNKLRTTLNYYGQTSPMDGQGRILIHPLVREAAGINGEVAVLGQQNFLEVWNRAKFEELLRLHPLTDEDLSDLAALGF